MVSKLEPISAFFFLVLVACSNSVASPPRRHDDSGLTVEQGRQAPPNLDCDNYPELLQDNSECVNTFELRSMVNALADPELNTDFNRNLLRSTLDDFCNTHAMLRQHHLLLYHLLRVRIEPGILPERGVRA